ncbi:6-pyruvoyl tetrahydropterin synthase [Palaeococcus pacificus DY20341]|uniref:6-pyruvoyl tetrahydropterin synthase n=1 Tax=Palaeococcus pacificus DY20341 TaxID=1343739 RepID=A0A075LUR2_9EURY|nr:6-carboxytetrahydropterin synthase [Palaeococcus pacificus]AIF69732.1 6-pyruvoyl tetrahydropterin synthase [Palaeococcus pacificus DY20341]
MRARIREKFKFEAAHAVAINGGLEEIHGHTYRLEVFVEGELKEGYVMDFLELRRIVEREVIEKLDHKNLNRLFNNPTTENIALWIAERIREALPAESRLYKVVLWEGDDNGVEFEF